MDAMEARLRRLEFLCSRFFADVMPPKEWPGGCMDVDEKRQWWNALEDLRDEVAQHSPPPAPPPSEPE